MGLFKKTGSYGVYASSTLGNDTTGDTSRNNPVATLTKARALGTNILLNGSFTENLNITGGDWFLTQDTSESQLVGNANQYGNRFVIYALKITGNVLGSGYSKEFNQLILSGILETGASDPVTSYITNSYINTLKYITIPISKCTIIDFLNYVSNSTTRIITDSLFVNSVDLYNFTSRSSVANYPVFKYCLFRKATAWKWNGATITINWTNNPVGGAAYTTEPLMQRVYNSLLYYANNTVTAGTDRTYAQAILATQATMFQDCVVYDDTDTVNNPIFSKYVGGVPVDYTLALKSNNPALYMSTVGSYVGCYAANVNDDGAGNALTFGVVKHVDTTTGADTATTPDLLIQDGSNLSKFSASQSSTQLWNRIRTSVVAYPRGKSFAGMQSQLDSGIASRLFFGKRQEIRTTGDITQKTTAFESVEVIPYDSIPANNNTTQNTINNMSALLPRFSAPFNGECLMFYKGGVPLLFNALLNLFQGAGTVSITSGSPTVTGTGTAFIADFVAGDNIRINGVDYTVLTTPTSNTSLTLTANVAATLSAQSYYVGVKTDKSTTIYGTWAVTNADIESYSLLQKTTKAGLTTSIPLIKYAKFELNLHYDEE